MAATDATPHPRKNVAFRATFGIYKNDGTLITGATALDSEVSKDGAAFADCTNEATEIAQGIYYLDLTATEMNADTVCVIVKTTSTGAVPPVLTFYPQETGDIKVDVTSFNGTAATASAGRPEVNTSHLGGSAVVQASGRPEVNVTHWLGSAAATPTVAGVPEVDVTHWIGSAAATPTIAGVPEVDITHIAGSGVSTSSAQLGVNVVNAAGTAWNSGAITASTIATDAIDSDAIAASALTEIADAILNRDFSAVSDTNARTLLNAARLLRNKSSVSAGTLTITKEDDSTSAWSATVTTNASAEPIIGVDPA